MRFVFIDRRGRASVRCRETSRTVKGESQVTVTFRQKHCTASGNTHASCQRARLSSSLCDPSRPLHRDGQWLSSAESTLHFRPPSQTSCDSRERGNVGVVGVAVLVSDVSSKSGQGENGSKLGERRWIEGAVSGSSGSKGLVRGRARCADREQARR